MSSLRRLYLLLAVGLSVCLTCALPLAARAQSQPDERWHGAVSLGGTAASGNTKASTLNAQGNADKESLLDKLSLRGTVNYGRAYLNGGNRTTANLVLLTGRYDYNLTYATFAFASLEGETNKVANVARRGTGTVGLGYRVLRDDRNSWNLFGGVGTTYLKANDGSELNGAQLLFGEESTHKLGENTSLKQRLSFEPSDVAGDRATFDAGMATAILGGWTLNTNVAVRYYSKATPGTLKTDTLLTVGFGYKY